MISVAPTGTISMIAEASSGIEPLFSLAYKKHNMSSQLGGTALYYVNEEVRKHLSLDVDIDEYIKNGNEITSGLSDDVQDVFKTSNDINYLDHVRMQAAWQKHVDSGISKTINLPNNASEGNIWDSYVTAWELGCKGITVYRNGSRDKEVLVSTDGTESKSSMAVANPVSPV